jgi:hypothetical protein
MNLDADVQSTARIVEELAGRVSIDNHSRVALRHELLRRHAELRPQTIQTHRWAAAFRLRRSTFVLAPAAVLTAAISLVLWTLQMGGTNNLQTAEAHRLVSALSRTAPTVASWEVVLQEQKPNSTFVYPCMQPPVELIYIRGDRSYLKLHGKWFELTPGHGVTQLDSHCPFDIQWAFAVLPQRLAHDQFTLTTVRAGSRSQEIIKYSIAMARGVVADVTLTVDDHSGLVQRLEQTVKRGTVLIERDTATYSYRLVV